jgi:ribosomal protein S8E
MTQAQIAKLASNPEAMALLQMMLGGNGKSRKPRSDKGFTKAAVADAQTTEERRKAMDAATVAKFTKAGLTDVQPRVNVLTYGKAATADKPATGWLAQGRKVKAGEKATFVKAPGMHGKGMPLFHLIQTEELVTEANTAPQS